MENKLTLDEIAAAMNEWMRRYIDNPERFGREFQTVAEFQAEQASGNEPSYGDTCTAYLMQINTELSAVTHR